jgi:hypothetical protein
MELDYSDKASGWDAAHTERLEDGVHTQDEVRDIPDVAGEGALVDEGVDTVEEVDFGGAEVASGVVGEVVPDGTHTVEDGVNPVEGGRAISQAGLEGVHKD